MSESKNWEDLVKDNMKLVYYVARQIKCAIDYDDLISIGNIGLIKAAKTFDKNKNTFATYAIHCIRNEIYMELRKERKTYGILSLNEIIKDCDNESAEYIETIYSDDNTEQDAIKNILLQQVYNHINKKSELIKNVFRLYFEENKKQEQVAQDLGISRSYVSEIITKPLKEIRNEDFCSLKFDNCKTCANINTNLCKKCAGTKFYASAE